MTKVYANCDALINGQYQQVNLVVEDGKVCAIQQGEVVNTTPTIDMQGLTVLPGLVDIHTHGGGGYDFNTADTLSKLRTVLNTYPLGGVTSILATVTTDSINNINNSLAFIARHAKQFPLIKGIHLEGPFLSHAYRGAQKAEYLLPPDIQLFKQFQTSAQGLIKLVTIAPELPNAAEFTRYAVQSGVVVSLGHSGASYQQTMACIKEGASSFTHTFNAMAPIQHHQPSILVAALQSDNYCEAIADCKHLHPAILKMLVSIKGDKLIAITDSIAATGLPDGEYSLADQAITKCGGDVMLKNTSVRAGSVLKALEGVYNIAQECELPLAKALDYATVNPCRLLGLNAGSIRVGSMADFFAVKDNVVMLTVVGGEVVYKL